MPSVTIHGSCLSMATACSKLMGRPAQLAYFDALTNDEAKRRALQQGQAVEGGLLSGVGSSNRIDEHNGRQSDHA